MQIKKNVLIRLQRKKAKKKNFRKNFLLTKENIRFCEVKPNKAHDKKWSAFLLDL